MSRAVPQYADHRKIIHVDMDAFYASVEQRDDPQLRGQPVVVGGRPEERGVVAAASYEARQFGVHSAMPMKTALRLCPRAIRVASNFDKYRRVSAQIHAAFQEYTDLIEPLSLDEAYLDVTYNKLDIPFGARVAKMIKGDIRRELNLTASAGVASNKFLAKIASDLEKPDGLVGDLAAFERTEMTRLFGKRGSHLWRLANGEDDEPVTAERDPKQVSQETTFPTDLYDSGEMHDVLRELADELSGRVRRRKIKGRVVTLKVRYPDFQTVTRSQTMPFHIDRAAPILQQALQLLERTEADERGVRLLGLGLAGFEEEQIKQLDLFATPEETYDL
jgi:DNA polymerase-4